MRFSFDARSLATSALPSVEALSMMRRRQSSARCSSTLPTESGRKRP